MANLPILGKDNYKVGLDAFYIGLVTTNTAAKYTHDAMTNMAGVNACSIDYTLTESEIKYDDKTEKDSRVNIATVTLTMEKQNFTYLNYILGAYTDETTGEIFSGGSDQRKQVAISFRMKCSDGSYHYYKFPVAKLGFIKEAAKTAEKADAVSLEFTCSAMDLSIGEEKRIKIEAIDKDAAFNDSWVAETTYPKVAE